MSRAQRRKLELEQNNCVYIVKKIIRCVYEEEDFSERAGELYRCLAERGDLRTLKLVLAAVEGGPAGASPTGASAADQRTRVLCQLFHCLVPEHHSIYCCVVKALVDSALSPGRPPPKWVPGNWLVYAPPGPRGPPQN